MVVVLVSSGTGRAADTDGSSTYHYHSAGSMFHAAHVSKLEFQPKYVTIGSSGNCALGC